MGWRDWSYWVKGGIIISIIYIIFYLIIFNTQLIVPFDTLQFSLAILLTLPLILILSLFGYGLFEPSPLGINLTIAYLINLIGFFVVGVLFGWIYGKIKNRA